MVRNSAAEINPDELNLLCMVDAHGAIIPGNAGAYGHIMISAPSESEEAFYLKSTLGVANATGVPAMGMTESTGAIESADHKTRLVHSFYAYVDGAGQPGSRAAGQPGSRGASKCAGASTIR